MIIAAVLAMAAAQPAVSNDPAVTLAAVKNMYEQSCQVRAYGSYDDLCNTLRNQMKAAEKALKQEQARARTRPAPSPTAGPATATVHSLAQQ
jgi:hypothetical protein